LTDRLLDRQDVVFLHDQILDTVEFDLLPGIFPEQNRVARLDVERTPLAALPGFAEPRREDLAKLRLLFRGIGNDDRAGALGGLFEALNDEAVV
jgi:hypothetical protein